MRLGATRLACPLGHSRERRPHFAWQPRKNQLVGPAKQSFDFRAWQRFRWGERGPVCVGKIGRGKNAGPLDQFRELVLAAFEREPDRAGLEPRNGVHPAADLEDQGVFPLDLLRGVRKRKAETAEPIEVHGQSLKEWGSQVEVVPRPRSALRGTNTPGTP